MFKLKKVIPYKLKVKLKKYFIQLNEIIHYYYCINFDKLVIQQRKNPLLIPIIIINFNQLFYLKQLISFLLNRNFQNIVIIDNKSTYEPLLQYYKQIEEKVVVEYMNTNSGHMVFFNNEYLKKKYTAGYYVITDADIVPNEDMPNDFMFKLIKLLDKYHTKITKVGLALDISSIPDYYPLKERVLKWECKYWEKEIEKNAYMANVDTTFALYKPKYLMRDWTTEFFSAIRYGGKYKVKHGGWYTDPLNMSEEQEFYYRNSSESNSWKMNEKGELIGRNANTY